MVLSIGLIDPGVQFRRWPSSDHCDGSPKMCRYEEIAVMARLIHQLLRPYRWTLTVILAALLLQMAAGLAAPWPLQIVLDNVLATRPAPGWMSAWLLPALGGSSKMHIAAAAGIITVLIAVVAGIGFYVANYFTASLGQWVANDLRVRIYHHLQLLSLGYYNRNRVGTILSTIMGDVQTIQSFASMSTLNMVTDSLTIVGMVALMFWLRPEFALIALAVTPFLAVFILRINKAIKAAVKEVRIRQSDLLATVQEGLQSIAVVQAFAREDFQVQQLRKASMDTVTAWLKARRVSSLLSPVVGLTIALCTAVVLWRGSLLILAGTMTAGMLTVFLAYLAKYFQPVRDLAQMTNTIAQVSVGMERVGAILEANSAISERPTAIDPQPFLGEITFEHVAFGYDPAVLVLRDVNFTITPGQMVGLVGPTGSGKSTFVSLIARFYDPVAGCIKIDGVDVQDYKLQGLRNQISFVLQETALFRGTVRDNIAFGRPGATTDEIVAAAKLANADEFIAQMREGYDSPVGDRGLTLSGGQRQRIGIARALIRNSPILILDEPTAALDAQSEMLVIEALERLMKGRTVITIAHRLSTIRNVDKIIVLKDGVVAEDGTNEELLAMDGIYAELHRIQYGSDYGATQLPLPLDELLAGRFAVRGAPAS
jgi:ABC-type multidrug transport system fused ATPase/permease subunit